MGSVQRAVPVLREQLKSCALISFELLSYSAARQSPSWINPILMWQQIGLSYDRQAEAANN
jgi:hypothetical protein